MSNLVFPSPEKPQIYISNNKNTIVFFVNSLLSSKKAYIQFLINMFRLLVPENIIYFLLKSIVKKENHLPYEISDTLDDIKEFISKNNKLFAANSAKSEDIDFIIRKSNWQRANNKFVIILFAANNKRPFAVAKIESLQYKDSIELEYNNTTVVYNKFKDAKWSLIPEPLAFYVFQDAAVYFERTIDGVPLNNSLKFFFSKKKKLDTYINVLEIIKELLLTLDYKKELLTPHEFANYFYKPIEAYRKTGLGNKYSSKLTLLQEHADNLQNKIYSVLMHGDLWGGSILHKGDKIGIIDWEFFTRRGVPLWDYFSIAFHPGAAIDSNLGSLDFMNYFSNLNIANKVDEHLLSLSNFFLLDRNDIPFLFQSFLLFNMHDRDTFSENYWQSCLEIYWKISKNRKTSKVSLL